MSEFARLYDVHHLPPGPVRIEASAAECAALARRFELIAIKRLAAEITLIPDGATIRAEGRLAAEIIQSCAVSGEDLPVIIDEPVTLRFVPAADPSPGEEEIELDALDCDEIEMQGGRFDLGEALAQSLALAVDPYAVGPQAEEARRKAGLFGEEAGGPFAALAALRRNGKDPD